MSYSSDLRLCHQCGGVTSSRTNYFGSHTHSIDFCDFCRAPLSEDDTYYGRSLPKAHTAKEEKK